MSRICPLFSSSSGNSTYIATAKGGIIVDAGASFKALDTALKNAGGSMDEIFAVCVTHEHVDHVKGLKLLLKNTGASLIASDKTLQILLEKDLVPAGTTVLEGGEKTVLRDIEIFRFATSHDCEGSSGYTFLLPDGKRAAVCTDLGFVSDDVRNALTGCDFVLLESNHDIEMLKKGPYPPQLKMRILSDVGHLSNNACAAELGRLLKSGTTRFVLGHLSRKNNLPLLAQSMSEAALIDLGAQNGVDYILKVASPENNGVTVL